MSVDRPVPDVRPIPKQGKRKRKRRKRMPGDVVQQVLTRSGGRCEAAIPGVCLGRANHIHHVGGRGAGRDTPENLLHLCAWQFGKPGCHEFAHSNPSYAYAHGLMRSRTA